MTIFDRYTWTARILPGLLVVLPPGVSAALLYPPIGNLGTTAVAMVAGTVLVAVITQVVRDRGRRTEARLFRAWGGAPTTRMLRHRFGESDDVAELHRTITRATGHRLPDAATERDDPAAADESYRRAVADLRELTRAPDQFPIVLGENIGYGFRRNTLAMKWPGIAVSLTLGAASGVGLGLQGVRSHVGLAELLGMLLLHLTMLVFWTRIVDERWVQHAAERYALALFRVARVLPPRT